MVRKIFFLCLIFLVCLFLFGCGGEKASSPLGGITGVAKLQGQSDYSGITVEILGTSKSTTTASDGSYTFSNVNATVVTLNFTKSGYASQTKAVNVSAGVTTNVATVTLSSSYGAVAGTVQLEGQTDHSGISVSIIVDGYTGTATTNSSGSYSFSNLTPGTATLNFSKSGFVSVATTNTITAAATTNISTVTLNISTGGISGIVTLGGTAAASITVTLNGTSTQTNSNGGFTFSNVTPGTYTLTYGKSGYISQSKQVTVTAGQVADAGTVTIYRPYAVVASYNMTSVLTGIPTAMTCTCNNLYIFTNNPTIYSVSVAAPTIVLGSKALTPNYTYYSMMVSNEQGREIIGFAFDTGGNNFIIDMFNKANLPDISRDETFPGSVADVPPAVILYDNNHMILYDAIVQAFTKNDISAEPVGIATYNVTATGIIGLDPNGAHTNYFACNTTTIYEYDSTFTDSTAKSQTSSTVGISGNLVAIAYDGTNIWTIDSNGILYKHLDNY